MFRILPCWNFETSSKDTTATGVVGTFLGPVELAAFHVERYSHAPLGCIRPRPWIALTCVYESFQLRAIQIGPHDSHSLAIRPIESPVLFIQLELLWSMGAPFGNNCGYIGAVEVRVHNGAVIRV